VNILVMKYKHDGDEIGLCFNSVNSPVCILRKRCLDMADVKKM